MKVEKQEPRTGIVWPEFDRTKWVEDGIRAAKRGEYSVNCRGEVVECDLDGSTALRFCVKPIPKPVIKPPEWLRPGQFITDSITDSCDRCLELWYNRPAPYNGEWLEDGDAIYIGRIDSSNVVLWPEDTPYDQRIVEGWNDHRN